MIRLDPWDHLRGGDIELGLASIREAHAHDRSASRIMELGVAYLWAGQYAAAWEHFQDAMLTYHQSMARFYGMAGVAQWCLNQPRTALEWWRIGMGADYADGAGGGRLPLLLYAASVLRPETSSRKEAEHLLRAKAEDPRVANWPGPLGKFVLGKINARTLEELSVDTKDGVIRPEYKWLISFYRGVADLDLKHLERADFGTLTRGMADTSRPEWSKRRDFLHLVWHEEFFIARHEASQT